MGTEFDPPSEANATGFYEDRAVRSVNKGILAELELSRVASRLPRWPWRAAVLAVARRYRKQMAGLVTEASGGWKDPLFSHTLEAWLPHLSQPPKVVVCLRSPEAQLHSVVSRFGLSADRRTLERRWANDLQRLLEVIRAYRLEATCVDYDDLVEYPAETVAALSSFAGYPLDAKYVETRLRHHKFGVPSRHAELYEQARALDNGNGADAVHAPRQRRASEGSGGFVEYLSRMRSVEAQVASAKSEWADRGGCENAEARSRRPGRSANRTSWALEKYRQALADAQSEFGLLCPPATFDSYHEAMRVWLDQERLVAHLIGQAAGAEEEPDKALRAAEADAEGQERLALQRLRAALQRSGQNGQGIHTAHPPVA